MRIVVTGAGGFVGRHVLAQLTEHDVVALDTNLEHVPNTPNITKVEGDVQDPEIREAAFRKGCDAVIHLATVPGGAAEINPDLAKSVNIDATMALIDMAAKTSDCPRFVFASSIAVFGKLPSTQVIDEAPTAPTMIYGGQKLMMEDWIATQGRRGEISGVSLRLPGIVARPKSPSGMKSAFLSDLFHALREGEDFTMPVVRDATSWICSVSIAARNLTIAASSEFAPPQECSPVLTPTLCVKMKDLEQEIRRQLGTSSSIISYSPDEALQSIFGAHPDVMTPKAQKLGFVADSDLEDLVKSVLKESNIQEKTND
jgi:nucleoside-diphosphate-sugar epimerase